MHTAPWWKFLYFLQGLYKERIGCISKSAWARVTSASTLKKNNNNKKLRRVNLFPQKMRWLSIKITMILGKLTSHNGPEEPFLSPPSKHELCFKRTCLQSYSWMAWVSWTHLRPDLLAYFCLLLTRYSIGLTAVISWLCSAASDAAELCLEWSLPNCFTANLGLPSTAPAAAAWQPHPEDYCTDHCYYHIRQKVRKLHVCLPSVSTKQHRGDWFWSDPWTSVLQNSKFNVMRIFTFPNGVHTAPT